MSSDRTVLITGAAGFIGSHLGNKIVELGLGRVVGIDNLRSGSWDRCHPEIVRHSIDLNEISTDTWASLLKGIDWVFHLAAEKYNSSRSTPERLIATNLMATERLFRASASARVKRLVFTSSLYSYGLLGNHQMKESDLPCPLTLYGASKLAGEHFLAAIDREISLSWNVARLFFIYGPGQYAEGGYKSVINLNFERLLRAESSLINGDGRQELDYVYIDDCVDALLRMASTTAESQVLNVASGVGRSIIELTEVMREIVTSSASPEFRPADWTHGTSRVGSPNRILEVLGWSARTSLHEGLVRTLGSLES